MASPEYAHPQPENPSPEELEAALSEIQAQLERRDEDENTMERYFTQDRLLEKQWELEEELREYRTENDSSPDVSSTPSHDDPS
jgi:YesN/AraC family two-component response regulator